MKGERGVCEALEEKRMEVKMKYDCQELEAAEDL